MFIIGIHHKMLVRLLTAASICSSHEYNCQGL
jgi:hypothetical protein